MDLFSDTQSLVFDSNLNLSAVARGAGVKQRWLHRYMKGDYKDVGVKKIQKIRKFLYERDGA